MNMKFQLCRCSIAMGIGHESGFWLVPEARFIVYMPAGFMSAMPLPLLARKGSLVRPAGTDRAEVGMVWASYQKYELSARFGSWGTISG